MRAVSRTTLKLGDLVEIPIGIVAATGSQDIEFETATLDGAKRVQQYVHPTNTKSLLEITGGENGGTEWPDDFSEVEVPEVVVDTIKGMRIGDEFRRIPESEIEAERNGTALASVEVLEFIDYRKVPTDRLKGSFWIQPDPGFDKPLGTILTAMRKSHTAMVVKYMVRSRQRLGVIRARAVPNTTEFALLLNDVVFADMWRAPDDRILAPGAVVPDERAVASALQVIDSMKGDGKSLETARDDLPEALTTIVERTVEGIYENPVTVLELVSEYRAKDLNLRADELTAYAEERWPDLAEKRKAVADAIASGEQVGEKLAAIVG